MCWPYDRRFPVPGFSQILGAYEYSFTGEDLDRLHGFTRQKTQVDATARPSNYANGSIVIDVSDGKTEVLLWRAAAVATVDTEDDLERKLARREEAVRIIGRFIKSRTKNLIIE